MNPPPVALQCISLVLCDDLFRDEASKKLVVVGMFNLINAPALPFEFHHMAILATLTGGHGEHVVSVAIEHERTGNALVQIQGPLRLPDPLGCADIDLRLRNVRFVDEGKHWVVVKDGGRIINQRPFFVRVVPQDRSGDGHADPAL